MQFQNTLVGLTWYRRSDYPDVLRLMSDAASLHETFDAWLQAKEEVERELKAKGTDTVRAPLRPVPFKAWCDREGLACNADARTRWAIEYVGWSGSG